MGGVEERRRDGKVRPSGPKARREWVKCNGKALSGDGEALRMTEGMEGNGEVPHMRKIVTLRR